nr:MAG TPA: hypothetical protein [Caudoviricetes sp.]DAR19312.1 MAG TPA: hypothetical protein [Caudoviricetes sp.]
MPSIHLFNIFNFFVLYLELMFKMCYIMFRKRKENTQWKKLVRQRDLEL